MKLEIWNFACCIGPKILRDKISLQPKTAPKTLLLISETSNNLLLIFTTLSFPLASHFKNWIPNRFAPVRGTVCIPRIAEVLIYPMITKLCSTCPSTRNDALVIHWHDSRNQSSDSLQRQMSSAEVIFLRVHDLTRILLNWRLTILICF